MRSSRRSTRRRPSWPPTSWTAASCSQAAARCCSASTSACATRRTCPCTSPSHRCVGMHLYAPLLAAARAEELPSFFSHHATPAGAAFAAQVGGRDDQRDVRSVLDLHRAELPRPHVPDGVELVTWVGATPDDLLESYVRARQSMADAPAPGGSTSPEWTIEKQLATEG